MKGAGEEILADIDATLDQLIENANVINQISLNSLFQDEVDALQKTQESLLSRLINMQSLLDNNSQKKKPLSKKTNIAPIQKKISCFSKLNALLIKQVSNHFKAREIAGKKIKKPVIGKNRKQLKVLKKHPR